MNERYFMMWKFSRICCLLTGNGKAKISLFMACLRKLILLIPLIFILPMFFENKVFAVFLAEPISDIIAAAVTTGTFFSRFDKILNNGPGR